MQVVEFMIGDKCDGVDGFLKQADVNLHLQLPQNCFGSMLVVNQNEAITQVYTRP